LNVAGVRLAELAAGLAACLDRPFSERRARLMRQLRRPPARALEMPRRFPYVRPNP